MSNDEFWYGEPRLAKIYRESHEMRIEEINQILWVAGLYNLKAFSSVAEGLAYGFSGGKGKKPSKYPENPLPFTEREQKADLERRKRQTLDWVEQHQ